MKVSTSLCGIGFAKKYPCIVEQPRRQMISTCSALQVAIVAVGESSSMSGEAGSRSSLDLPGHQLDLVKAVHATGTPTMSGAP